MAKLKRLSAALLGASLLGWPVYAVDPPHTDGPDWCANCHTPHTAVGDPLTIIYGNANLCQSCHQSGGTASGKALANGEQALPWPGLPNGMSSSGSSHRWDSGLAGHVSFSGGALTKSTGWIWSSGVYTGAYAKTYTVTIVAPGSVGTALFNWSATSPGGGAGSGLVTGTNVALNDGIMLRFVDGPGVSFQTNDQWQVFVRPEVRSPTNWFLAEAFVGGRMDCSTCHDPHSQAATPFDPSAPAYAGSDTGAGRHYMRLANDAGQLCLDCHAVRNVTNAAKGSHPVSLPVAATGYYRSTTNLPLEKATGSVDCLTCHQVHFSVTDDGSLLRMTNRTALCLECHTLADTVTPAGHLNSTTGVLWPGGRYGSTFPAAGNPAPRGACGNCHQAHGWPDSANPTNHYPSLLVEGEENLCYTCHDGSQAGLANIRAEFQKTSAHPVTLSGIHQPNEGGNPAAFGSPANRHAECSDCHNPHQARSGYAASGTTSYLLQGVSRVAVANGAAGTRPLYTYLADTNTTGPIAEYQVCFKCHSSWTTLPAGALDKGLELNPNNASFHPVEAGGRNATPAMVNNLLGGTGLPHLTTNSTVWCSDCHNSDAIPLTVSVLTNYTGTLPRGPHGANRADTNMSPRILRANYKVKLKPVNEPYAASDFTLCFICHSSEPFNSGASTATNFRYHALHTRALVGNPASGVAGDVDTPSGGMAGQGNAICKECHYTTHSTALTYNTNARSNEHLVSFSPSISGRLGTGAPVWNAATRTCTVTCHGESHNESY